MTEDPMRDLTVSNMAPRPGESNTAYRERIAVLQAETLDRRQQELNEQRSGLSSACALRARSLPPSAG